MTPREAQDGAGGAEGGSAVGGGTPGQIPEAQGGAEADRERAMFILFPELAYRMPSYIAGLTFSDEAEASMNAIAAALAEERAKARAPFLALAEELRETPATPDAVLLVLDIADRIRRAAGEAG